MKHCNAHENAEAWKLGWFWAEGKKIQVLVCIQ